MTQTKTTKTPAAKTPAMRVATPTKIGTDKTTKKAQLIALLKASTGADIAALAAALDWQTHTVRAALTRLKQAGYVLDMKKAGTPARTFYQITAEPKA